MSEIFLSASVPLIDRGSYHETANPFLIQCAVRELIMAVIRQHRVVWGGHPAITPMIWSICEDLGINYSESVVLYQSKFFEDRYPEENQHFKNVIYTEVVSDDQEENLKFMREQMLSREELIAAVFIGGMDGVEKEYVEFNSQHPTAKILLVPSPGGAALNLARDYGDFSEEDLKDIDFARLFHQHLVLQIGENFAPPRPRL